MEEKNLLIEKIRKGEVVLWVGAGFSKYAGYPTGKELVAVLKNRLSLDERKHFEDKFSLSEVAEEFFQLKGRNKLLQILKEVFNSKLKSTEIHDCIYGIPQIENIITTNYDKLFEFVYRDKMQVICKNSQLSQAVIPGTIKLFKIHGDLDFPETVIITQSDYNRFFQTNQYEPFWTKIRSLIAERSILFMGYSFEDQNIRVVFDDILEKLDCDSNEGFLVVPNLPAHKIKMITSHNLHYLDMVAEDIVREIKSEIRKKILLDCKNGYLDIKKAHELMKNEGIETRISYQENYFGVKLLNIKNKKVNRSGHITFNQRNPEVEKLIEYLKSDRFEKFEGSFNKEIVDIREYIGDIEVPVNQNFKQIRMIFTKMPTKIFKANLFLKEANKYIGNLKGETFQSKNKFKVFLTKTAFTITLEGSLKSLSKTSGPIKFSLSLSEHGNFLETKEILDFVNDWLKGDEIIITSDIAEGRLSILDSRKIELPRDLVDNLKFLYTLYFNLFKIQNFFKVNFTEVEAEEISKENIDLISQACVFIDKKAKKIKSFKIEVELTEKELFDEILSIEKPCMFTFTGEKDDVILLFGEKLRLGKIFITGQNCYLENKIEVKESIKKEVKFVPIVIVSKTDDLYYSYKE
jgi:hypothetical protein